MRLVKRERKVDGRCRESQLADALQSVPEMSALIGGFGVQIAATNACQPVIFIRFESGCKALIQALNLGWCHSGLISSEPRRKTHAPNIVRPFRLVGRGLFEV